MADAADESLSDTESDDARAYEEMQSDNRDASQATLDSSEDDLDDERQTKVFCTFIRRINSCYSSFTEQGKRSCLVLYQYHLI